MSFIEAARALQKRCTRSGLASTYSRLTITEVSRIGPICSANPYATCSPCWAAMLASHSNTTPTSARLSRTAPTMEPGGPSMNSTPSALGSIAANFFIAKVGEVMVFEG